MQISCTSRFAKESRLASPGSSFVCIVGPSGCGKSTLLNIVAGFLKATSGEILVEGLPVRHPDPRRIFVFQENGVFPWLNVHENVGFGLRKQTQGERDRIIAGYIDMVGLGGFENAYRTNFPAACANGSRSRARAGREPRHHLHG